MSWLNDQKAKGREAQLCLNVTPLATQVQVLISKLERSPDPPGLVRANIITALRVS